MKRLIVVAVACTVLGGALVGGAQAVSSQKPRGRSDSFSVPAGESVAHKIRCLDSDYPNWDLPTVVSGGYRLGSVKPKTLGHKLRVVHYMPVFAYTTSKVVGWKVKLFNPTNEPIWAQVWIVCGP